MTRYDENLSDAWLLISFIQQFESFFNSFSHFILKMMCRKISLSILSIMSKCIIKSIKFWIENGLNEFGIPEL